MAVTRSRAGDRAHRPPAPAGRERETLGLLAASLVVLFGLALVYFAKTHDFATLEDQLQRGQIVDLGKAHDAAQLAPQLEVFRNPADRASAAAKIHEYLSGHGTPPNVGALARIRAAPGVPLLTRTQVAQVKPHFIVREPAAFRAQLALWILLYLASFYVVHGIWRARRYGGDAAILPVLHLLTGVGLILMVSLRDPLRDTLSFVPFAEGVVGGCGLLLGASFLDFERLLGRLSFIPLVLSFALSAVLIVFGSGPGTSDAKVNLGPFQPVEAIKILLVFFLAGYFAGNWEFLRELKEKRTRLAALTRWIRLPRLDYVLPLIVGVALARAFFFLQRDLGPALVISCTFLLLYSVARSRFALGLLVLVGGFWAGYQLGFPRTVADRVAMWLAPWDNLVRGGDQVAQGLWALASGGVFGTGLGLGRPETIPAGHTDLVLPAIGEEWGFLGFLAVFVLYAFLMRRCLRIVRGAPTDYTFFLALGFVGLLAVELLWISGSVLGLLPLSGVVTPFLSYGRTAMLANFTAFGILLSISRRTGKADRTAVFHKPLSWFVRFAAAAVLLIVAKAAWIQVFRSEAVLTAGTFVVQADGVRRYQYNPRLTEIARQFERGAVYDRNGLPLATSRFEELEAHRREYEQLGISIEKVCSRLDSRHYPLGEAAFHVLGDWRTRLNWAAGNAAFVEREANLRLQGWDDHARIEEAADRGTGEVIRVVRYDYRELVPLLRYRNRPGAAAVQKIVSRNRDVRLSIDARLQVRAAQILAEQSVKARREAGAIVVLDPGTGDVLALANYPLPAGGAQPEGLLDRARYGLYPPGSIFKLVTALAALRRDPRLAEEVLECRRLPGGRVGNYVRGWGRPIRDDPTDKLAHGKLAMARALAVSCNAYFAQLAAYRVGARPLHETASLLGIVTASPDTPEQLRDNLPQAGYGQGQVLATPFQLARVAATIANGGQMPYGRWAIDESNTRTQGPRPVLEPALAAELASFMRAVVTEGTGQALRASLVPVAGKTGTAEVAGAASHAWFAGFAPYGGGGRRIAFAVLVEHGQYGGGVAATIAGEIVAAASQLGILSQ